MSHPDPQGILAAAPPNHPRWRRIAVLAAAVLVLAAAAAITYRATNQRDSATISASTPRAVTATIHVGRDPQGVAIDPTTHTAYTTNHGDGTVSVIAPTR